MNERFAERISEAQETIEVLRKVHPQTTPVQRKSRNSSSCMRLMSASTDAPRTRSVQRSEPHACGNPSSRRCCGSRRIGVVEAAPDPSQGASPEVVQLLRVLIANERRDRLELLAQVVTGLGHEVIAREVDVREVAAVTSREHPDVALVGLGLSSDHALELIGEIVHEASCPVIALLSARDPACVRKAARRGVFAYSSIPPRRSCTARSRSRCSGSPNTTTCRAHSGVER
jgi:CheY-like chemotaxis protein